MNREAKFRWFDKGYWK